MTLRPNPSPVGLRVLECMAARGGNLPTDPTAFGLTPGPYQRVLEGLRNRGLIAGTRITGLGRDELSGEAARRRRYGSRQRGEANRNHRLTEADVRAIREAYTVGKDDQYALADQYGASQSTVSDIVRRRTWRHVA